MTRTLEYIKLLLVLGVVLFILGFAVDRGCDYFPESSFQLANESRLPKWITLPSGLTRADVSITMNYYVKPWGRTAQFILRDEEGRIVKKENGKLRCRAPFELKSPPQGFPPGYPAYEEITVLGMTEIIEHKKMEPIFYITDDPTVWKQYSASGCG